MNFPVRPSDTDLKIPFHDYQKMGRELIINSPYCGLFLDCGLGKTLITLAALYDLNPSGHILIVAPKTIARSTWQKEIDKWRIPIRTRSLIVNEHGKDLTRKKRLERYAEVATDPPTMYFINRELLSDLIDHMPKNSQDRSVWYFPIVVLDEAQSFKSHTSVRFKKLAWVRPAIRRLVELTGTPTPRSLMDLWAELFLLDQGQRLGPNISTYRRTFFSEGIHINNFPVTWNLLPGAEDEIYRRIRDIVFSIKNPALILPPVTYNELTVVMDDAEKQLYQTLLKEKVLELVKDDEGQAEQASENDSEEDIATIIAKNAGVLQIFLSQMASGTLYTNKDHDVAVIHNKKLDMLEHVIETTGSPVLVAYWFACDKDRILTRIPQAKAFDGSAAMQDEWNAGQIPVMLIHPASAGFGINIQDGGHTLVWYTVPWSLENFIQTNARLARQGQKYPVMIHMLLTEHTIDSKVVTSLKKKDLSEETLLNAVSLALQEAENTV